MTTSRQIVTAARRRGDLVFVARAEHAATIYAAWNNSDPHAYARMMNAFESGFELPSDIQNEFEPKLIARRARIAAEAENMMAALRAAA